MIVIFIKNMTIFVCGSSGILGRELCKLLKSKNIEYTGSYNYNKVENAIHLDFLNSQQIEDALINLKVTICVNCIVERQLEICENNWNNTKKTNIDIPNHLSKICSKLNIHLIHISTDYVFDGMNAPYYPDSQTNPLQNYGISKLISEYKVKSNATKYTIIRVPVLYTDNINNLQDTAVTLIGKKILNRIDTSKEDNFSVRRPNYIPDFCNFIYDMIMNPQVGVYHFCNPHEKVSKYQVAQIISEFLHKNLNVGSIDTEPNDGAERPKDTFLKDTKYNILDYTFTPLKRGLERCFQKLWHPVLDINRDVNTKNVFFMIDLDGTLVDTDKIHYECYRDVLKQEMNVELTYDDYYDILENQGIDLYLENTFGTEMKDIIKTHKNDKIQEIETIQFINNAYSFIEYLDKYDVNHVVVTNTSLRNVEYFKKKLPLLNKIKNWVVREDYTNSKPCGECYELAKQKYYRGEETIIGIENTMSGFSAVKNVTDCIYIVTDKHLKSYETLKSKDVYLINDFSHIFTQIANSEQNNEFVSSVGILRSCSVYSNERHSGDLYCRDYDFNKLKDGDSLYICVRAIKDFFDNHLQNMKCKFVLVSGDGDEGPDKYLPSEEAFLNFINNEKIIRWYCINSKIKHEKLTIIPYGLDYHTMSFGGVPQWGHMISCYDQELLLKKIKNQAKPFWERKIMCYSNFHHSLTNNIDRVKALNEIPNNLIYYQYGLLTRETTWINQTEYAFVVSPSGVGLDCIRTWEALCFGCIPIVKKCGVEDLFIDLPVLIVNEWSEITNELLVDTVEKFKNMTFNYEKLKLKYWADQINQYRHLKI